MFTVAMAPERGVTAVTDTKKCGGVPRGEPPPSATYDTLSVFNAANMEFNSWGRLPDSDFSRENFYTER